MSNAITLEQARAQADGVWCLAELGAPPHVIRQFKKGNVLITEKEGILWDIGKEEKEIIASLADKGCDVYHILSPDNKERIYLFSTRDESIPVMKDEVSPILHTAAWTQSNGFITVDILSGQEWLKVL